MGFQISIHHNHLDRTKGSGNRYSMNQLDHYQIIDSLTQSNFSRVLRARRKENGEVVCIKNIKIFDMDSKERKRNMNEAKLLSVSPFLILFEFTLAPPV